MEKIVFTLAKKCGRYQRMHFYATYVVAAVLVVLSFDALGQEWHPEEVALDERGHGWLITGQNGMMLYTYTRDQEPGKSTCIDACSEIWPPFIVTEEVKAMKEWSTLVREDGRSQWAFRGQPLYYYSNDVTSGDMNGDALNQQWYAALKPIHTPPGFTFYKTPHGHLLVDSNRMTLYSSKTDTVDESKCDASCASTWKPVDAPWISVSVQKDWQIITRKDETKQWVYKGKPLYRYAKDFNPGEISGDGTGTWYAIVLEPPPLIPEWVTFQRSDGGELLADPEGKTLYRFVKRQRRRLYGPADQVNRPWDWKPVLASADAKPVGEWSLIEREDGTKQWAHKGLLLFVSLRDKKPGDITGIRAGDRRWRPIMTSGKTMPGTGI